MSMNNVCLCGNLVADPKKGKAEKTKFIEFSIAVNDYKNGETVASFFDCTMYGKRAEAIADMLKKGMRVCLSGKLRQDRWEKDGEKRSKVVITVFDIDFIAPKPHTDDADDGIPW